LALTLGEPIQQRFYGPLGCCGHADRLTAPHAALYFKSKASGDRVQDDNWTEQYHQSAVAGDYDRRYRGPIRRRNNARIGRAVLDSLRLAAGGQMPKRVLDIPAGTGRFTGLIRAAGSEVISLDRSAKMLGVLREKHGPGLEFVADLHQPPLHMQPHACILSLRLMQHYNADERVAALRSFRKIAPRAVVAYYPGWDWKNRFRRLRQGCGLPVKKLRESISAKQIDDELAASGWTELNRRVVTPWLSENVLLTLSAC